jgi:hypothetical protein
MGEIIARNMLSWLELLINHYRCIYSVVYIICINNARSNKYQICLHLLTITEQFRSILITTKQFARSFLIIVIIIIIISLLPAWWHVKHKVNLSQHSNIKIKAITNYKRKHVQRGNKNKSRMVYFQSKNIKQNNLFLNILLVQFNHVKVKQIHRYRTVTCLTTDNSKQGEASVSAEWTP